MAITRCISVLSVYLKLAASRAVPLALRWVMSLYRKRRGVPDPAVNVLWLLTNSTPASEQAVCRCRFDGTMALLRLFLARAGMIELSLREACGKTLRHIVIKSDHAASETGPLGQLFTMTWRRRFSEGFHSEVPFFWGL